MSKQITNLEKTIEHGKNLICERIEFTFGNGSVRGNVCDDKDIIQLIRELIVKENESKLKMLKKEFSEL